ncbi:MAG: outer membrane beta-barrel protein [Bdellovibrionaceae bacterium]|nr:outer membrane beta-barrel protein [Pseudobdellovibrionaceae bacterium]
MKKISFFILALFFSYNAPGQDADKVLIPDSSPTFFESHHYWAIGLHYSSADRFSSDAYISGSVNGSVNYEAKTDTAFTLSAEFGQSKSEGLGFNAGLGYDTKRTISSITAKGAGGTSTSNKASDSFSVTTVYYNPVYYFDRIALNAGINYSIPKYEPAEPGYVAYATGAIGYQAGLSYFANEKFLLNLDYRVIKMDLDLSYPTLIIDFGRIEIKGIQFGVKYLFK